jgi:hypothetical protein
MSVSDNPVLRWLQTTTFLFDLNTVRKAYEESYRLLPKDVQNKIEEEYLHDIYHSMGLLLCMMPYRDIQYGPKGKVGLRRRMKLGWIAYNINAVQKLLNNWGSVKNDLEDWYHNKGHPYKNRASFNTFINFLQNYLQTTIAELCVLYVYLYNDRPVMPLGFMQHLVTLGTKGPTLGDLVDIETLTFIEVKSKRAGIGQYKGDLLSLMINTRLPSAIAVPRYRVEEKAGLIDENGIVVEIFTLGSVPKKVWMETKREKEIEADIDNELKLLMQGIALLRENAENYLQEIKS